MIVGKDEIFDFEINIEYPKFNYCPVCKVIFKWDENKTCPTCEGVVLLALYTGDWKVET